MRETFMKEQNERCGLEIEHSTLNSFYNRFLALQYALLCEQLRVARDGRSDEERRS